MKTVSLNNVEISPSKIVCIGRNYVEHIKELGNEVPDEILIFSKPNSAISHTLHAFHSEPLHYEGELCFMYDQGAFTAIGFGLDLTKRTLQSHLKTKGLPWERAKAFNGSALFSAFASLPNNLDNIRFELSINGSLVQQGNPALMMYSPDDILKEISTFMDLEDGDIVMTGTPKGVGLVNKGDTFSALVFDNEAVICSVQWLAE